MRNARELYLKIRDVKYHHVTKLYKKLLRKIPENCKYNYPYKVTGDDGAVVEIRLCLLHQPELDLKSGIFPHLIDICQEQKHCISCNAFVLRYTKDTIKEKFETDLKNKTYKEKNYPEICALEWAMGDSIYITIFEKIRRWFKQIVGKDINEHHQDGSVPADIKENGKLGDGCQTDS
jgi:hypothetical protein